MVSRITEIQTNDGEITLGELIRFLLSTPEFQTKKMTDVLLSLTEHTHNVSDLENSANLVRKPELNAALDEFDKAVAEALNSLESRIDVPFLRAQLKALQDKPDFDPSRLEKRLKALESQKPEHKTTVIQNFDKSRIDKIEKKQSEVVTLLGKIIDDSNLKVEDLRKEIAAEIGKKIQKEDKHVNIIGGVGGVNKLKLLFDVNIDGITNGQTIAWNSTTEKFEPTSGGGGGSSWGSITGTLSDQTDLQAALDAKVTANASITGATKTKITYDAKGLVTAGADATTADIADSTNKRYVTDAQLTVIGNTSGTNTGDVSVTDSSEIDFTLTGQNITASIIAGSIDETKLDDSVNASLDLADSALQSESDTLQTVTDRGATTTNTVTLSPSGNNKALIANGSGTGAAIDITHSGSGTKLNIGATNSGDLIDAGSGLFKVTSGGSISASGLTASTILSADGSKNIVSLSTATYPSLTELSYLKGVTSAVQTQLNNKQPLATVLTNTTASFTTAQETKLSGIETGATADQVASEVPVTPSGNLASTDVQAGLVELQGDIDTINSSLGGLTDAVVLKGTWDASAGTFPGSGSAQAGWSYIVSVAGTVDSVSFAVNDRLLAVTDNASTTTYASNWHKLDYTDQVLSVNSQTGAVVLDADDIDDTSTTNKFTTASDISKLAGIEAGADVTDTANVTAAGALMDSEVTNLAAVKAFDPTDYQAADSDLTALANNSSNGLWARTGSGTGSARTITGGGGISVTNGNGVSGNPTLGVSALQSIWIPASAMWPSNSGGCGALAQQTVGVNRPDIKYLPFDPTSVESAEFTVAFPKGWNEGTITAQFYWTHPSTTTNFGCIWSLQGVALSDDDAHDTTWGTQQQVTDTGGTTYDVYVTSATSAITIAGTPAAGDICYMHLLRRAADGGDTLAVDAWLLGVKLFFTIDTLDDT